MNWEDIIKKNVEYMIDGDIWRNLAINRWSEKNRGLVVRRNDLKGSKTPIREKERRYILFISDIYNHWLTIE